MKPWKYTWNEALIPEKRGPCFIPWVPPFAWEVYLATLLCQGLTPSWTRAFSFRRKENS